MAYNTDPSHVSSPYYLHHNENPSLVLVTPPLSSLNYHHWPRAMRMALLSKNKLQFVDGTIPAPPIIDPLFHAWERCNNMVISWLNHSITPSIFNSVLWLDKASEIWIDLRERFSQGDLCRISDLQEEIYAFKQDDKTVTDYFTKLKILWDELLQFRPLPSCSCDTPFTCGAVTTARTYHNQDYVIRFLKGLNDSYSAVRSQILLMEPLPSINKVFSKVIQQERQLSLGASKVFVSNTVRSTGDSSRKSQSSYSSSSSTIDKRWCTFCQRLRHTIETCYKKNGYPSGSKPRPPVSRAHNVVSDELDDSMEDAKSVAAIPVGQSSSSSGVTLTQEQYDQLLTLLHSTTLVDKPSTSSMPHVTNHIMTDHASSCTLAASDGKSLPSLSIAKFSYWIVDTGLTILEDDWYN
ncbi:hypothetical protein K2173_003399 [Erythroxylum novogranatense]|uniref:Retrotransposon Copia-like N-terminal domain-containing protein n=1 Tax=Erythroxylum novogranatense TaxID=1862640 RepID=A0AAV8S8X2_9ROSI|nr:hypothetical protein K2173_003399 [Erythroxylum novogranatense]